MKNLKKLAALILFIALALSAFVSCGEEETAVGKILLVIGLAEPVEYEVELSEVELSKGLFSVLDYLKTEKGLFYEASGTMINSVGDLKPDAAKGEYIFIYTSVREDFDVSTFSKSMEYKGTQLTSAGIGAAEMTICDGAVIYIGKIVYG